MDNRKDLLLTSAARLYSMGVDLEAARDKLKEAYQDFKELEQQWKALERQHLELRDEIVKDGQG